MTLGETAEIRLCG